MRSTDFELRYLAINFIKKTEKILLKSGFVFRSQYCGFA